ncbi:MAG: hypothetical protein WBI17_05960 [Clostridiaceae bacterium]
MKNRIKKHKFDILIVIVLMMLFITPFFGTKAMLTDVEIQPVSIQITTGILDITLKDNTTGNIGALNYNGNINNGSYIVLKENLSVENIGTLVNDLSVKSSFSEQPGVVEKFRIELIKSNGQSIDISGNSYISLKGFINSGDKFALKISYNGLLPTKATTINAEIYFRGTQPNDQQSAPTMFTDVEKIQYTINVAAQNINSDFEFASNSGNFRYSLKELNMYYGYDELNKFVPYNYGIIKLLIPTDIEYKNLKIKFDSSALKYIKENFDLSSRVLTLYFEPTGTQSRDYSFWQYDGQIAIDVMDGSSIVKSDQIGFRNNATSRPAYVSEIGFTTDGFSLLQNNGFTAKLISKNIVTLKDKSIFSSLGYLKYENNTFSMTALPVQLDQSKFLTFSQNKFNYIQNTYPYEITRDNNGAVTSDTGMFKIKSQISDRFIVILRTVVNE